MLWHVQLWLSVFHGLFCNVCAEKFWKIAPFCLIQFLKFANKFKKLFQIKLQAIFIAFSRDLCKSVHALKCANCWGLKSTWIGGLFWVELELEVKQFMSTRYSRLRILLSLRIDESILTRLFSGCKSGQWQWLVSSTDQGFPFLRAVWMVEHPTNGDLLSLNAGPTSSNAGEWARTASSSSFSNPRLWLVGDVLTVVIFIIEKCVKLGLERRWGIFQCIESHYKRWYASVRLRNFQSQVFAIQLRCLFSCIGCIDLLALPIIPTCA